MRRRKTLHLRDALQLLTDRQPHRLRAWKMSTGDILTLDGWQLVGQWTRQAALRLYSPDSGEIRMIRARMIFEVDGMRIYW